MSTSTTARCAGVGERDVRVALPSLVIDPPGRAMVVLALLVDDVVAEDVGQRNVHRDVVGIPDAAVAQDERRRRSIQLLGGASEDGAAHCLARREHRTTGHPRLARGGRRPGVADRGVGLLDHDLLHTELGAHDLRHHGGEALPALRGGAVDVGDGGAVEGPQPDASGPEVVDAARVADRLHAERIADPAPDALAVGDVAEPAGKRPQVELAAIALGGQRQVAQMLEQLAQRRWSVNGLASREYGALDERVAQSQLQGVDAHCGSEPVDRRLDGVAGLHGAEAAASHRTGGCS